MSAWLKATLPYQQDTHLKPPFILLFTGKGEEPKHTSLPHRLEGHLTIRDMQRDAAIDPPHDHHLVTEGDNLTVVPPMLDNRTHTDDEHCFLPAHCFTYCQPLYYTLLIGQRKG